VNDKDSGHNHTFRHDLARFGLLAAQISPPILCKFRLRVIRP
jgi:hypothetical protein